MGHKINPCGFRIGITRSWNSFWYGSFDYATLLEADLQITKITNNLGTQHTIPHSKPLIARWLNATTQVSFALHSSTLGNTSVSPTLEASISSIRRTHKHDISKHVTNLLLSEGYGNLFKFKQAYLKSTGNIFYFTVPITCSQLIACYVSYELKKRNPFKEIMQDVVDWIRASKYILGVHVCCSGRFSGENRTRTLWKKRSIIPYSTISACVDFSKTTAINKYGAVGIKVWVYYNIACKSKYLFGFNEKTLARIWYYKAKLNKHRIHRPMNTALFNAAHKLLLKKRLYGVAKSRKVAYTNSNKNLQNLRNSMHIDVAAI